MGKKKKETIGECGLCHLGVLYIDDYIIIDEFSKGNQINKWYYHRNCFRERLNGTREMRDLQKMARGILTKANDLVSK